MREMRQPPYEVSVLRDGKWTPVLTTDVSRAAQRCGVRSAQADSPDLMQLCPGDLMAVTRGAHSEQVRASVFSAGVPSEAPQVVPCDLLLLSGSVVVNEALLTGESVPQIKACVWRLVGVRG